MAGRGSAERSRAARPRWVMMEISSVARASTAERSGSSSGACCRRNDRTSDPSTSFHHEGGKLHVRVLLRRVPASLAVLPHARRPARRPRVLLRVPGVFGTRVGVGDVDVATRTLVVRVRDVQLRLRELHHGLLARRAVRGMDSTEHRRPGVVLLLDPLVPLRDVLLVVHPREVAHATQPPLRPIPQGIVPAIDPAANVAQLLVSSPRVLRAVGACEAMPANATPSGVLVVAVLSNAPHTLEARQESWKLDPQPCAGSGEELIRGHLQSFSGKLRSAGGLGLSLIHI